ncbi:alpha-amylase family glycosyl hydrolase [Thermococcus sp.]
MRKFLVVLLILLIIPPAAAVTVPERTVVYQVMVDRFYDGNQSNDNPLYDPSHTDYRLYWGGDLQGIIDKLDYIRSLGVGEIWLSPVNDNINRVAYGSAPYHGYWTRDYFRIEEHFGSWSTFERLVREAKKRGMCIIVGFVPNHSNPAHSGEYGSLYRNGTRIADYLHDAQGAKENPYTGSVDGVYHHNGDIKEWYGFQLKYANLYDLADFNQHNPAVDSYLKEAAELFAKAGVCGFRIDAAKHMQLGWLETLYLALYRSSEEPLFIYNEYYDTQAERTDDLYSFYMYSNVTSNLNIPIRKAIANTFAYGGSLRDLSRVLEQYYYTFTYPNKNLNFLDSHDLVRFLNMNPSRRRFHMALKLTMTLPGIPVVYYGDESYLVSKKGKGDPYNRPMMVFNNSTEAADIIRELAALRRTNDALAFGDFRTLYADYSLWAFERTFGNHSLLVVVNKRTPRELNLTLNWPDGTYDDLFGKAEMHVKGDRASISVPGESVLVFHREGKQRRPLIGSLTPYSAQPGQVILIGGVAFGREGDVLIGGEKAEVINWSDGSILVKVPELRTDSAWVNVTVETSRGNAGAKLHYYSGNEVPVLVVIRADGLKGYLWIKGNLPELAEPRPLLKSSTGYYFTVVPLPNGTPFQVELYNGLPWDELEPTGRVYHGVANWTAVLEPGPLPDSTTGTQSTTSATSSSLTQTQAQTSSPSTASPSPSSTPKGTSTTGKGRGICGPAVLLALVLIPLLRRR